VVESEIEESPPEYQVTLDRLSDEFTGAAGLLPVLPGFAATLLPLSRLYRELNALTSEPGTSPRPRRGRLGADATVCSLFVGMVAFNPVSLGVVPVGSI